MSTVLRTYICMSDHFFCKVRLDVCIYVELSILQYSKLHMNTNTTALTNMYRDRTIR